MTPRVLSLLEQLGKGCTAQPARQSHCNNAIEEQFNLHEHFHVLILQFPQPLESSLSRFDAEAGYG